MIVIYVSVPFSYKFISKERTNLRHEPTETRSYCTLRAENNLFSTHIKETVEKEKRDKPLILSKFLLDNIHFLYSLILQHQQLLKLREED